MKSVLDRDGIEARHVTNGHRFYLAKHSEIPRSFAHPNKKQSRRMTADYTPEGNAVTGDNIHVNEIKIYTNFKMGIVNGGRCFNAARNTLISITEE